MSERKCPDCGERLSFDAQRCACGWGARKGEKPGKFYDMRCTYRAGTERCNYPVGMFTEGNTSGWCIFHRQPLDAGQGSEIVRQSYAIPYADAIRPMLERAQNASGVVETAHEIALRHGKQPWQAGNEQVFSAAIRGRKEAA